MCSSSATSFAPLGPSKSIGVFVKQKNVYLSPIPADKLEPRSFPNIPPTATSPTRQMHGQADAVGTHDSAKH